MRAPFSNSLGLLLDYFDFPYDFNSLNFFHFFNLCTLQIKTYRVHGNDFFHETKLMGLSGR